MYTYDLIVCLSERCIKFKSDKKAVLSQRWPRNAPHIWMPWKFSGLPDYAHDYFSQNFSQAFVLIDPMNVRTKFEVRSFTRSWDNRGYLKKLGSPWISPRSLFSKIFNGLLLVCILWMYLPNFKPVVPELIGGSQKIWAVPNFAHTLYSHPLSHHFPPKILYPYHTDYLSMCTRFPSRTISGGLTFSLPTSNLPKFHHLPLGVGGTPFRYKERMCWANCPCN